MTVGLGTPEYGIWPRLVDVVEERVEPIELLLRDRVVLVIVAACALDAQSQEGASERVDPIDHVFRPVLLRDDAALLALHVVAVEAGREQLLLRRRSGSRSPASCQVMNVSNGRLRLNAEITQSRHGHICRIPSSW